MRHSKRLTTIANNKIEQLQQYIIIKVMLTWFVSPDILYYTHSPCDVEMIKCLGAEVKRGESP